MKNKSDSNDHSAGSVRAREKAAWNDALLTMLTPGLQKLFCPEPSTPEQTRAHDAARAVKATGQAADEPEPQERPETMVRLGKANDVNENDFSESVLDAQNYVAARRSRKLLKS